MKMDSNSLSKELKLLVRNAALDMPCWTCLTYTEKDYRKKKNLNTLREILFSILIVACIGIFFFECGGQ